MKKIKPIVLKNATRLTNSEMKKIRGGYEPEKEYLAKCSATCEGSSTQPYVVATCEGNRNSYCDIISGANVFGVGCFMDVYTEHYLISSTAEYCPQSAPPVE